MKRFPLQSLLLCSIIAGCSTTTPLEKDAQTTTLNPISVQDSRPIAFARIIFKLPEGKEIGGFYDGLAHLRRSTHYWNLGTFAGSDQFRYAASEELRNAGYNVLGAESLVFGEDKADKARYQLGGTVSDLTFNTYGPLAGNRSEAKIFVEYQLMDAFSKDVKWTATVEGYGKTPGNTSGALMTAFRDSIRHVLSRTEFAAALKPGDARDRPGLSQSHSDVVKIELPRPTTLKLPENMDLVMDAVIVIKVGRVFGSGFLISRDGFALTAAHVVSGTKECMVRMRSGLELPARVLRTDQFQDIALIKVEGGGHKPLQLMLKGLPQVGADLFAIGAPADEALACSVSKGVVSGHREMNTRKFIQTDASLNPGNSGGPLIDREGRAVAVVSWKLVSDGVQGLAFGVPVQLVAEQLGIQWETKPQE